MSKNSKASGTAPIFGASTSRNTSTEIGQSTTASGAKLTTNNHSDSTVVGVQTPAVSMFGSLFESSTPKSGTELFGQPTTSRGGFGDFAAASNSGALFGTATPSIPSTDGLFGTTDTSAFGTPRFAFGGFGTTNDVTGFFGQNTSGTSLFGTTAVADGFNTTAQTGTRIEFNAPTGIDTMMKAGVSKSISTMYQCITYMKEYENKSLEELRMEDYAVNGKLSTANALTQTPGTNLFGQNKPSTTEFGTTGNLFGVELGTGTFGTTPSTFSQGIRANSGTFLSGDSAASKAPESFGNASSLNFGGSPSRLPSTDPNKCKRKKRKRL